MLNQQPIFVNGFQRGGTNILVNLISSHRQVEWVAETHMIFYGDDWDSRLRKWSARALYLPIFGIARQHIFWINKMDDRRELPEFLWPYIDWRLYSKRQRVPDRREPEKQNNGRPTRPLFKNVNAMTLATDLFARMYPDAFFVGLVRDGLALCEGFVRRGFTAERFGKLYQRVVSQMIEDSQKRPNYHLVRFEDLIAAPEKEVHAIYDCLNLDLQGSQKFRLQAKRSMDKDGQRRYMFGGEKDREMHWFEMSELRGQFRTDVNDNQIAQLAPQDKETCLKYISEVMDYFGYPVR